MPASETHLLAAATAGLPPFKVRALAEAVAVLREFYDPPAIFLFGSTAKGADAALSDIDLLVRLPAATAPRSQRGGAFKDVFHGRYPRFDAVFFTDAEIDHHMANPRSFLCSVLKAARPLYLKDPATEPLLRPRPPMAPAAPGPTPIPSR